MGKRSRREVADAAYDVALQLWGEDAPLIDERYIKDLQDRLVNPPADGRAFRCVLYALGIPVYEALALIDYAPDLAWGGAKSVTPDALLVEALRIVGLKATVRSAGSTALLVQLR